jgi:hypothetical protein
MITLKNKFHKLNFSISSIWILSIIYFLTITTIGLSDWFSMHSYRQSQTALTSLFFPIDGYRLDYTTPMMGYPWKVPMEFPIYQFIISIIVQFLKTDIIITGKVFYILLHVLNNILIVKIFRMIKINDNVCFLTLILLNISPYYLVWTPSFLPDYFGLFLTILATFYLLNYLNVKSRITLAIFIIISILCVLNKITTYIATLLPLSTFFIVHNYRIEFYHFLQKPWQLKLVKLRWLFLFGILLIVLLIGIQWTTYCDTIKTGNSFSSQWISSKPEMILWNLGTLNQRLNVKWWIEYLSYSMIYNSLFYTTLTIVVLYSSFKNSRILIGITLFILPPLVFFNLFHEHNYYSIINMIFFYYVIAEAIYNLISCYKLVGISLICLILMMIVWRTIVFRKQIFQPFKSEIPWNKIDFHPGVNDIILSVGQARDPSINFYFHCRGLNLNYDEIKKIALGQNELLEYTHNGNIKMITLIDDKPSVLPRFLSSVFEHKKPRTTTLFFENKYYTFYWIN